ncbi:MAG: DUF1566 domain-containing protein [Deltaproteobacteria bacterium]|nr:DUF1566 domain-containing protein [Deltaproteobacteria bacterium]
MSTRRTKFQLAPILILTISGQASADAPVGRYVIESDIVTDVETGLVWARSVSPNLLTYTNGVAYCSGLSVAGRSWRLPTVFELMSLVDRSRSVSTIDPAAFPNTPIADSYWTSTPYATSGRMLVRFEWGHGNGAQPTESKRVRCVSDCATAPETDAVLCANNQKTCGETSTRQACGPTKTVYCGGCAPLELCVTERGPSADSSCRTVCDSDQICGSSRACAGSVAGSAPVCGTLISENGACSATSSSDDLCDSGPRADGQAALACIGSTCQWQCEDGTTCSDGGCMCPAP